MRPCEKAKEKSSLSETYGTKKFRVLFNFLSARLKWRSTNCQFLRKEKKITKK